MKKLFTLMLAAFCCAAMLPAKAQLSIVSASVSPYNITPQSICQVSVMNASPQNVNAVLEARVINSANEVLLTVTSAPFQLKTGLNSLTGASVILSGISYGSSNLASYVRNTRTLPSGYYQYCCYIKPLGGVESGDELCQDVEGNLSSYLHLVTPFDKDTIQEEYPLLAWTHSEPFNILSAGEYFRLVVVELSKDQKADAGIMSNVPIYVKNHLLSHQVQYPMDARKLEKGKRYGWQVQKLANGAVVDQSEAWEFTLAPDKEIRVNKYALLKRTLDGGFYTVEGNRLYFRFDEEYAGQQVNGMIFNEKREKVLPKAKNEDSKASSTVNIKNAGYNRFELNLDELSISSGFHTLEVKNEKGELFLLKFYVP